MKEETYVSLNFILILDFGTFSIPGMITCILIVCGVWYISEIMYIYISTFGLGCFKVIKFMNLKKTLYVKRIFNI